MRRLYIKQKAFSWSEHFDVTDAEQQPLYTVGGSLFKLPKQFIVRDATGTTISAITSQTFSLLPKFFVKMNDNDVVIIAQQSAPSHPKYLMQIDDLNVVGDWWQDNFEFQRAGQTVATVTKKWFTWASTYELTILDAQIETLAVSCLLAIDYALAAENSATN